MVDMWQELMIQGIIFLSYIIISDVLTAQRHFSLFIIDHYVRGWNALYSFCYHYFIGDVGKTNPSIIWVCCCSMPLWLNLRSICQCRYSTKVHINSYLRHPHYTTKGVKLVNGLYLWTIWMDNSEDFFYNSNQFSVFMLITSHSNVLSRATKRNLFFVAFYLVRKASWTVAKLNVS
jgi:hypothetical protein